MRRRAPLDLRSRLRRVRAAGPAVLQTAGAAGAAWYFSTLLPGHTQPFFAPIAAVVALGSSRGRRGRQAVEMVLGVAAGIGIAEVLAAVIGYGPLQMIAVVVLAMGVSIFLGRTPLFVSQAAVWGILVIAIPNPAGGYGSIRFFDALIGAGVALLVSQVLFPVQPLTILGRAARPVLDELQSVLGAIGDGLRERSSEDVERALEHMETLEQHVGELREAVSIGTETARHAPTRRRSRPAVSRYANLASQVDLAVRNVHVLAAGAARLAGEEEESPPELADAVFALCRAVACLRARVDGSDGDAEVEEWAARAARRAQEVYEARGGLAAAVVAHQVESTAYDLLRGSGLDREEAHERAYAGS